MRIEHEEICTIKEVGQAIKISTQKKREIENGPDPKQGPTHAVPTS